MSAPVFGGATFPGHMKNTRLVSYREIERLMIDRPKESIFDSLDEESCTRSQSILSDSTADGTLT